MDISLNLKKFEKVKSLFNSQAFDKIAQKGLVRLGQLAETKIGLEARNTVYSYEPKTDDYIRTGRLLGGRGGLGDPRPSKKQIDPETIKIEANPMLKGASYNYAPDVNDGTGWMKGVGPRPFWDDSEEWIKTKGLKKSVDFIKKEIEKHKNKFK